MFNRQDTCPSPGNSMRRLTTSPSNEASPFKFNQIDSGTVNFSNTGSSVLEKTTLQKCDLKIKLGNEEDYVEIPSNFSVTPKANCKTIEHVESVASYHDQLKPKLADQKNDTAIKRKLHVGRQSALIEQILSAGSYKNRSYNSKIQQSSVDIRNQDFNSIKKFDLSSKKSEQKLLFNSFDTRVKQVNKPMILSKSIKNLNLDVSKDVVSIQIQQKAKQNLNKTSRSTDKLLKKGVKFGPPSPKSIARDQSNTSLRSNLFVKNLYQKRAFKPVAVQKPAVTKYSQLNSSTVTPEEKELPSYMRPLRRKADEDASPKPATFLQKTRSSIDLSKAKKPAAKYINQGPIGLSAKIKMLKQDPREIRSTLPQQVKKRPSFAAQRPVDTIMENSVEKSISDINVSRNQYSHKFNSNSSSFEKPFQKKRSMVDDFQRSFKHHLQKQDEVTRPESMASQVTQRQLKSSTSFTALSGLTSARSRVLEEQQQQALKKKQEEERIKQLRKAREIGNTYSTSYSRENNRSQVRATQYREAKQKIQHESPEKDIQANIEISLDVSSIKKGKDDTLDEGIFQEIREIRRSRQAKSAHHQRPTHQRKGSRLKNEKFEKYATSLRFINFNFGGVLKGYKARRIYSNNSLIRQYRIEYRDLIQFAFMLQNEIATLKNVSEIEFATNQLRLTLEQMKNKREQFQMHFLYLLESENWLRQCQPSKIQDIRYEESSKFELNMTSYRSRINQIKVTLFQQSAQSINSDIDHMLKHSPKKPAEESFEELSREHVLPVPETVPERPVADTSLLAPLILSGGPIESDFKTISPGKSNRTPGVRKSKRTPGMSSPKSQKFVSKIPRVKSRGSSKSPNGFKSMREHSNSRIPGLKSQKSDHNLTFQLSHESSTFKFKVQNMESKSSADPQHLQSTQRSKADQLLQRSTDRLGKRLPRSRAAASPVKSQASKSLVASPVKSPLKNVSNESPYKRIAFNPQKQPSPVKTTQIISSPSKKSQKHEKENQSPSLNMLKKRRSRDNRLSGRHKSNGGLSNRCENNPEVTLSQIHQILLNPKNVEKEQFQKLIGSLQMQFDSMNQQ